MNSSQPMFRKISGLLAILLMASIVIQAGGFVQTVKAASINLLSGATVAGYSTQSGSNVVANVYDGVASTYWQPTAPDRAQGPSFTLNLGAAKAFNKVDFDFIVNNSLSSYKIQYSLNGTIWSDAYNGSVQNKDNNKDNPKRDTVTFPTVTGQYVKVSFQSSQLVESGGPVWTKDGSTKTNDPTCGGATPCYIYTNNFQLAEMGLYDEGPALPPGPAPDINLALGASVTPYSSQTTGNSAANMVDGKDETFWQPNSTDRALTSGAWAVLNLGSTKSFNKAVFNMPLSNGVDKIKLEYSNDSSNWTKAYEGVVQNKGTSAKTETISFDTVSGRYVKITITFSSASPNFQLSEFQLFNYIPPAPVITEPAPVTSAFTISANGKAAIYWTDPVTSATYLPFDHVIVSNGSSIQIVGKGQQSMEFSSLTNGQTYQFEIQTVTADNKKSKSIVVSAVPSAYPNTLLYDSNQLINVKSKLKTGGNTQYAAALNTLLAEAELAIVNGPYSVMYKNGVAPSGNKHDYWSSAPYWWPDPTSPNGLPYINRDGETNPDGMTDKYDKQNFTLLRTTVSTLSLAYYYTDDEKYAARAALLLKTWFIDTETRMNPNMNYAQGVAGAEDGRKEGVLESDKLFEIIDSIELISKSGSWSIEDTRGFKSWLSEYTNWLKTSPLALAEKATINNHGTWYDAQYAAYIMYLGQREEAKKYLQDTSIARINSQILPDGTMPEELRRTRPFHYFLFNLIPFSMIGMVGDHVGVDFWNAGEGGIRKAYQFITPYIADFSQWPYDELRDEDERAFSRYLREAAVRFGDDSLWSAADMMLDDQVNTHRANLIAPGLNGVAPRKEIVDFQFQGLYVPVSGTIQNSLIEVNVPKDTDLTALVARFKTTGSSVKVGSVTQINGVTANDFRNPVTYTVISPDGAARNYIVRVNVLSNRLPVAIYETAFTEYRNNPVVDEGLALNSSNNLYDVITPMPVNAALMELGKWYNGYLDNGNLKAPANIFAKDGNSSHTRSMPAALRLLKDTNNGSVVTLKSSTKDFKNISVSFAARTQNTSVGYTVYSEWSVDGGATWNVAHSLKRDSLNSLFTETYGNNPVTFSINDQRVNNSSAFLFRLRLDKSSVGYVNVDDFKIMGEPLYDLTPKELLSFAFQGINPPVTGTVNGTNIDFALPEGIDLSAVIASFKTTGIKVRVGAVGQVSGVTPNNFTSPVVYSVEAADGSWRNYTVKVTTVSIPGTGGETPGSGGETPGNGEETPGNGGETPGNGGETPGNGGETPGSGGETPGNGGETPGNGGEAPGNGGEAPGNGGEAPGNGGETPGSGGETPGTGGEAPGSGGEMPGNGGETPGNGGEAPGKGGEAPGNGGEAPGNGGETPGNSGDSSSDSSDSSSGGTNSNSSNTSSSGTNGKASDTDTKGQLSAVIEADSRNNTASARIDENSMTKAFAAATINSDGTKSVELNIPEVKDAKTYTVQIPSDFIASNNRSTDRTTIVTELGSIMIPANMLQPADWKVAPVIQLSIGKADPASIQDKNAVSIGDRPVYEFKLIVNGAEMDWNNVDAPVTVSIPYKPTTEEMLDPEHIVIWYIANSGEVTPVSNSRYNAETGKVTFTTNHFSKYAISFVQKTFSDIQSYGWAKKQIEVLASKGIINGTSDAAFQPGVHITRADFLVLLVNTLGINGTALENFDDVLPSDYYYDAAAKAKKMGITDGVGNNKFNPQAHITRQEMMTLTARAMNLSGKMKLSGSSKDLIPFEDTGKIASFAVDSIASMIKQGLVEGADNRLYPEANATRAETAVFMYRLYNQ
ncbi:S-layer homology domain-containing protein [Paenibacillus sp. 1_12]|uniref:alginate lyase family protein n=1 Tax=Paenibacillus sp. 1_12 TaxID=1566278 RepID=UPI0008E6AB44|nr:alginate lyase family protein [Paenibacillus sp. 1_12]SFL74400.1 S-layer homology domain-containing protein [Paenibacillus sp. 1_12]